MSNQRLKLTQLATSIALVAGSAAFISSAHAAAPAAGTTFSNVASASYTDSTGTSQTATSNIVTTTVLQVGSFTLTANQTITANKNQTVSLSHTLTNTGNGTDTFTLAAVNSTTSDNWDFTGGFKIYLDANKDGIPDGAPITSVTLTAGQSVNLIVESTTTSLSTANAGDNGKLDIAATNAVVGSVMTVTNTDTVNLVNGAVMKLVKSATNQLISEGGSREVEYTLLLQNTGNAIATNAQITDILPRYVTYVANSATLDNAAISDVADTDGYLFTATTADATNGYSQGNVALTIPSLAPNVTKILKFKVTVDANAPAGNITNIGYADPDGSTGSDPKVPSNPTDVVVAGIKKGTINDSTSNAYDDNNIPNSSGLDNKINAGTIAQGQQAIFGATGEPIVIHNTGNVAEEFDVKSSGISGAAGEFPAGTLISLYQADGVTPFVGTGLVPVGGTYTLIAKATLPTSYSTATPITAVLTINPKSDPSKTDKLDLVVNAVTAATVDLHNGDTTDSAGAVSGATGKDTGQFVDTKATKPGQSVNFPLEIDNKGMTGDNFNLTVSNTLPAGWDVKFYAADAGGNPTGAPITNTGNIPGTPVGQTTPSNLKLVAVVTPPVGTPASQTGQEVLFKATSPVTGLSDVMSDKVIVLADRLLTLENNRIDTVAPGGTVTYTHTLTNKGNMLEGATSLPFTAVNDLGWNTSVYVDLNNNGIADANELVTTNDLHDLLPAGLATNASVNLIVKVQAPTNATVNQQDRVVLTISPTAVGAGTATNPTITHAAISNTDLTTVTGLQVRLLKEQAVADCTTGVEGTYTQNTIGAKPGECVRYRITAKNEGLNAVTNVVISDKTPNYTTFQVIAGVPSASLAPSPKANVSGAVTTPANNGTGTVSATEPTLAPNASATLEFVIKVNPLTP